MNRRSRTWLGGMLIAAITAATLSAAVAPASAAPLNDLDAAIGDGDVTALMAASATLSEPLSVFNDQAQPKHFWVDGFAPGRTASWDVSADQDDEYHATVLFQGTPGQLWRVSAGGDEIVFEARYQTWDRLELGTIDLTASDTVVIEPLDGNGGSVKSVELVRESAWAALNERAAQFRAAAAPTRDEFSSNDWGLFFQYGPWAYPETGETQLDIDEIAARFDVEQFADWVEETGAGYVIWSISWYTYELQMPLDSVDAILGNGTRTSERDLVGELAREFQSRDMMFVLYYHTGQDEALGYESTDWWQTQEWPREFTPTGSGNRELFFENWKTVITEIGTKLGDDLDGIIFDDGLLYYPANFEELGAAARAGNPERFVSYNSWIASSYTPFQDVLFGEECPPWPGQAEPGGNGVFTDGPFEGQLEHCQIRTENDWGVNRPNQEIEPRFTAEDLACEVSDGRTRNAPTSISMMMWSMDPDDPASVAHPSPETLSRIQQMTALLELDEVNNDTDPRFAYSGEWGYASNRPPGQDVCRDVHYTTRDGDSVTFTFEGTGATILGPVDVDPVVADVAVDGVLVERVSLTRPSYTPQQVIAQVAGLPFGEHTITLTKRGGTYLQTDSFVIEDVPVDTSAPVVELIAPEPAASGWYTAPTEVSVTATDDSDATLTVEVSVNGGEWAPYAGPIGLAEGETAVAARATDAAGNTSEPVSGVYRVDTIAPTASGYWRGARLYASGDDAGSGVEKIEIRVGRGQWREYDASNRSIIWRLLGVQVRATDVAGNVGAAVRVPRFGQG